MLMEFFHISLIKCNRTNNSSDKFTIFEVEKNTMSTIQNHPILCCLAYSLNITSFNISEWFFRGNDHLSVDLRLYCVE